MRILIRGSADLNTKPIVADLDTKLIIADLNTRPTSADLDTKPAPALCGFVRPCPALSGFVYEIRPVELQFAQFVRNKKQVSRPSCPRVESVVENVTLGTAW